MKRTIALSLLLLLLSLAACEGSNNPTYQPPNTTAVATATPEPTPKEPETLEEVMAAIEAYCASEEYDRARLSDESYEVVPNTMFFTNIRVEKKGQTGNEILITGDVPSGIVKGGNHSYSVILEYCIRYKDFIDDITIRCYEPGFDLYGNERRTALFSSHFKMDELLKVNWDNFDYDNVLLLAYDGIIHNQPSQ